MGLGDYLGGEHEVWRGIGTPLGIMGWFLKDFFLVASLLSCERPYF